jgi:hypothetical protein
MFKSIRRFLSFLLILQLIIPYSTFAAAVGEFTSVVGSVTQTRAKELITPVVKSPIEMKDLIATAHTSSATMVFSDDSTITLAENTKLEIKEFLFKDQSRKGLFSLAIGKLTADVKKYIGGDNVFEVNSPTAIVGVRGTGFEFVEALKDGKVDPNPANQRMATVSCTDGSLNLSALSATGEVVSTGVLEAGQMAVIIGGVITISAIVAVTTAAIGAAGGTGTGTGGAAAAGGGTTAAAAGSGTTVAAGSVSGGAATAATAGTAAAATGLSTATIAGIAIGSAAVVGGAAVAAGGGGGGSSPSVNSVYTGAIGGNYTSTSCYSGAFTMRISPSGDVTGTYTRAGTTFTDLYGSVTASGQYRGTVSSGGCAWLGSMNVSGSALSGNGTWDCGSGCNGLWSGNSTGSVTVSW